MEIWICNGLWNCISCLANATTPRIQMKCSRPMTNLTSKGQCPRLYHVLYIKALWRKGREVSYEGKSSCGWRNLLLYFIVTKSRFRDYFKNPSYCVKQVYCWISSMVFHSYQKPFYITLLFDLKLLSISSCQKKLIAKSKSFPSHLMRTSASWCKLDMGHKTIFFKL